MQLSWQVFIWTGDEAAVGSEWSWFCSTGPEPEDQGSSSRLPPHGGQVLRSAELTATATMTSALAEPEERLFFQEQKLRHGGGGVLRPQRRRRPQTSEVAPMGPQGLLDVQACICLAICSTKTMSGLWTGSGLMHMLTRSRSWRGEEAEVSDPAAISILSNLRNRTDIIYNNIHLIWIWNRKLNVSDSEITNR